MRRSMDRCETLNASASCSGVMPCAQNCRTAEAGMRSAAANPFAQRSSGSVPFDERSSR